MKEWITTKEASKVETIGLTQHRIAELARQRKIIASKAGKGKWLVKTTLENGKYKLSYIPTTKTEQGQVSAEQPPKEIDGDTRLTEHFHNVANTARLLASRAQKLLYCNSREAEYFISGGNIVDGLRFVGAPFLNWEEVTGGIKPDLARCVFVHYEDKFGKSPYDYWEEVTKENVSQEVADNLLRLANSNAFEPCPKCPICVELVGIEPVSPDSIPIPDEKAGRTIYVPKDF